MPKFEYVAKDRKGERIEGTLEVEDREAVVARLQTMGYFPMRIEDRTPRARGISLSALRGKIPVGEMVNLNRQLADLVSAGVPLVKALTIILNQMGEGRLRDVVVEINKNVQGGDTLAQAMQRHPSVFSPLNVALVRAGETGGMLPDVLQRLADFSEAEQELRGKVLASLAYPVIMTFAGSIVVVILMTVVMPKITGVYADLGQTLPAPTQMLISISDFLRAFWPYLLVGVVALFVAFGRFVKTKEGKRLRDAAALKIPVLGGVVHKRELAQFARTLGNLLRNGVPILTALDITNEAIGNAVLREELEKLPGAISQGAQVADTLAESPLFPPTMVSMVAVGEETAHLDEVLLKVSETYERQVDRALKTLTSMLEPLIILALGVVVGFIVISMLLPIMSLDPTGGG